MGRIDSFVDLCNHLGVELASSVEDTVARLKRRVYKDTSNGLPVDWTPPQSPTVRDATVEVDIVLDLVVVDAVVVVRALTDRRTGTTYTTPAGAEPPLPKMLEEYLLLCREPSRWILEMMDASALRGLANCTEPWAQTVVHTADGALVSLVGVELPPDEEAGHEGIFHVYPYCEGFDGELSGESVMLPCDSADIDSAIEACEQASNDIWSASHGCDECWSGDPGAISEYGTRPVDPACPSCGGDGIVI